MSKTFEEKLDEIAPMTKNNGFNLGVRVAARWGRTEGIREGIKAAIEMLRMARNKDGSYVGAAKAKDMRATSDWLEEQFKNET